MIDTLSTATGNTADKLTLEDIHSAVAKMNACHVEPQVNKIKIGRDALLKFKANPALRFANIDIQDNGIGKIYGYPVFEDLSLDLDEYQFVDSEGKTIIRGNIK